MILASPPAIVVMGAPSPAAVQPEEALPRFCPELRSGLTAAMRRKDASAGSLREQVWTMRTQASSSCLDTAALVFLPHDLLRARELAALSWVRLYYDEVRCTPVADPVIAAKLDYPTPETIDRQAVEKGIGGAARVFTFMSVDPARLYTPADAWRQAVRRAASSDEAYDGAADLKTLCALSSVRSDAEWRALRVRLQAAVAAATTP